MNDQVIVFIVHRFRLHRSKPCPSSNPPTLRRTSCRFRCRTSKLQAKAILLRAQQRAEQIARRGADRGRASSRTRPRQRGLIDGRKEGLAKGIEEGKKAGQLQALAEHKRQLTELIDRADGGRQGIEDSRELLEANATTEVVELAVSIARRVTKRHGQLDPNGSCAMNLRGDEAGHPLDGCAYRHSSFAIEALKSELPHLQPDLAAAEACELD